MNKGMPLSVFFEVEQSPEKTYVSKIGEGLTGPLTGNNRDSIIFSPRGWLRNPSVDFNTNGYMEFHFHNQEAGRIGVFDVVKVQISRAGMIRLLRVPRPYNLNTIGTSVTSSVQ